MYQDTCNVNATTLYTIAKPLTVEVRLNKAVDTTVMLDSGSEGNFIHLNLIGKYGLETHKREKPLRVTHVQGKTVVVINEQVICKMQIGLHTEVIIFDVCLIGKHKVILGVLWLTQHEPKVQWEKRQISFPSEYCQGKCIIRRPAGTLEGVDSVELQGQTQIIMGHQDGPDLQGSMADLESYTSEPDVELDHMEISVVSQEDRTKIPEAYHNYLDVFDGDNVRKLPPFSEGYDFKIDLKADAVLPKPAKMY
jgi:hypothetical protein